MDFLTLMTSVTPSRDISFTITVIVAGLGIVLSTLALLIIVFYVFGAIVSKSQKVAKEKAAKKVKDEMMKADLSKVQVTPDKKQVAPAPAPVVEQGISGEVVAAISAAVYSMEGSGATIRSISRTPRKESPIKARNPWAQAAIMDNTRPF